jgi:hypothetical protein
VPRCDLKLHMFQHGEPPPNEELLLLCQDGHGTYLLPYACEWREGAWYNTTRKGNPLSIEVVGWRPWLSARPAQFVPAGRRP